MTVYIFGVGLLGGAVLRERIAAVVLDGSDDRGLADSGLL